MTSFPWRQHLNVNTDPNWQVKTFTDTFLNIMSSFVPNEIKRFVPRNPPWITKPLKTMLNRKNRLLKNYKRHGYKAEDKVRIDGFRIECQQAVETAKLSYLTNLGNKVNSPGTSQKSYWKIINRVMNKCRAPKIPPLLVNNLFILNCREKPRFFNDYFSQQCKPLINTSVLPIFRPLTNKKINHVTIGNDDIVSLIRKIYPDKATGSDGISGQMLLLCDESVILPLQIIFTNILSTSLYPDMWKFANVPQISVLGPLLFLVYINDIERNIKSNVKFFADDTMLFSIVKDPKISANDLNHDLDVIHQWANHWKLEFNPDPNKQATEVLFSCKISNPSHPQIMFNGTVVSKMNEHKHLGLLLDSSLSFKKPLNEKIIKAEKNLGIIKHLSIYLPRKTLDQMYKALIRSHLDYCDNISYTICTNSIWCDHNGSNGKS